MHLQKFAKRHSESALGFAERDVGALVDPTAAEPAAAAAAERVLLVCYKLLFRLRLVPPLAHWDPATRAAANASAASAEAGAFAPAAEPAGELPHLGAAEPAPDAASSSYTPEELMSGGAQSRFMSRSPGGTLSPGSNWEQVSLTDQVSPMRAVF